MLQWNVRQPFGANQTARQCKRGNKTKGRSSQLLARQFAESCWDRIPGGHLVPIKQQGNTKPPQRQVKLNLQNPKWRLHVSRPFGGHVRAWAGPQQSTLVSPTKLRRMVIADDDADQVEDWQCHIFSGQPPDFSGQHIVGEPLKF